MEDSKTNISELRNIVMKHVVERHWENNPPRGLAISILLEASELLEHYQWSEVPVGGVKEVAEELADILIYMLQLAVIYDIDLSKEVVKKLKKSASKYPVEKFSSINEQERKKAWIEAKRKYKKETIL